MPASSATWSRATTRASLRRHFPCGDALRHPFDDGGLAHARLADERGVVLVVAQQDIHDARDLRVPAAHRLEVAAPGLRGEVHPHALEHRRRVEQPFEGADHRISRPG